MGAKKTKTTLRDDIRHDMDERFGVLGEDIDILRAEHRSMKESMDGIGNKVVSMDERIGFNMVKNQIRIIEEFNSVYLLFVIIGMVNIMFGALLLLETL